MAFSSEFIDQIVQNVMRELQLPQSGACAAGHLEPAPDRQVTLRETVISEDVLRGRVAKGGTIVVAPRSVITPSGRDWIRQNQLNVVSGSGTQASAQRGIVLLVGQAGGVLTAAASVGWDVQAVAGSFDAANQTIQRSCQQRTVCCSRQPAVIACLVNRNSGRRAAVVTRQTCLAGLMAEMNPDTVCLDPTRWAVSDLMRLLRRLNGDALQVPEEWRELA